SLRYGRNEFDLAIEDTTRALAIFPGSAGALRLRGLARGARGGAKGAPGDLDRALEDPTARRGAGARGARAAARPAPRPARAARAIELEPKVAGGWYLRGQARSEKGDEAGARSDLETALHLAAPGSDMEKASRALLDRLSR